MQLLSGSKVLPHLMRQLLCTSLVFLSIKVMAYEEAVYSVVFKNDVYEIRKYSDRLAIQINYVNQSSGFQRLFKYISGSNIESTKINMTVPVAQSGENESKVMQFFLPSDVTNENAPAPIDEELNLITVEQGYYAVITYSGRITDKNFDTHKATLREHLLKGNIEILSSAIKATYNGPFTLPFLRRNEAMFRINWNAT